MSPPEKNKSFSLKSHELREKKLVPSIEACWNSLIGQIPEASATTYQAYVDGSFLNGNVGYGAVVLKNGEEVTRFSGSVEQYTEQRQVGGELQATIKVLEWCQHYQIGEIEIFYDYEGVEKWVTGEWRAKNEATQRYAAIMRDGPINIIWHKVKSHTGVHWNEVADELAKQGALSAVNDNSSELQDPLAALEAKATGFQEFLANHGILAEFRQIYNGQYARIVIEGGFFDLYNTTKRPMSPYLHAFKDEELQIQVQTLWDTFETGLSTNEPPHSDSRFEEVEHYLELFEPYRDLPIDFTQLAVALSKIAEFDVDVLAYSDDFGALERIYHRIRNEE